jgi:2,3-dihydroxybiphenyl 1,2-dioxygenase
MTISQLAYLVFEVSDPAAWHAFGTDVLGMAESSLASDGSFSLRHDDRANRIFVTPGPADDLLAIGWEVAGDDALEALLTRLTDAGVAFEEGSPAACALRGVKRLVYTADPAGIPNELVLSPARAATEFASPHVRGGFVAGDQGLGHLVVSAPDKEASRAFYVDLLGFRLSDHIVTEMYGHAVDLSFFHTNPRHHSIAFGGPQRKRLHHFMVEARSMDDVGLAFDRTIRAGHRIMQTLGRHPNDRMFSFYARTPSKFQFEFGWGGREVDDATWEPTTHHCVSEWGHHPPHVAFPPPKR